MRKNKQAIDLPENLQEAHTMLKYLEETSYVVELAQLAAALALIIEERGSRIIIPK